MNATTLAKTAYANPDQPTRTLRGIEYELFARVTHRLKSAALGGKENFAGLARAVYENRRLWTVIAADVSSSENALPAPLRARLFYLSEFTQAHSRRVLAGEVGVDVLVDINTSIMRGLRQKGDGE
ncbi:MAG: flagellar biosynthesis regulator FlaF [Sphingomonadales bacterium]|nr:flagellar biosynthesis regulator FlaF [Sphingomonadales bacterium]